MNLEYEKISFFYQNRRISRERY